MEVTIQNMVERWSDPNQRPLFKGLLIDQDGCKCAQGDVLHCAGMNDSSIRAMYQKEVDKKVADILGISVGRSILLRNVNDSADGCPQEVLSNPEKVLGPNYRLIHALWEHLERIDLKGWVSIVAEHTYNSLKPNYIATKEEATLLRRKLSEVTSVGTILVDMTIDDISRFCSERDKAVQIAGGAIMECIAISVLPKTLFLDMFFKDVPGWIASVK